MPPIKILQITHFIPPPPAGWPHQVLPGALRQRWPHLQALSGQPGGSGRSRCVSSRRRSHEGPAARPGCRGGRGGHRGRGRRSGRTGRTGRPRSGKDIQAEVAATYAEEVPVLKVSLICRKIFCIFVKTSLYFFYFPPRFFCWCCFKHAVCSHLLFPDKQEHPLSTPFPSLIKNTSLFFIFFANLRYYTLTCHTIRHYLAQLSHFEEGWKQIRQLRVQRRVNRWEHLLYFAFEGNGIHFVILLSRSTSRALTRRMLDRGIWSSRRWTKKGRA